MISGTVPPRITHLNDIGDVNVPAPVDGYFVYWAAAAGKWKCKEVTFSNGGGGGGFPPPPEGGVSIVNIYMDPMNEELVLVT